MSGQQQILTKNQESLYNKASKDFSNQINLDYIHNKFRIGKGADKLKMQHSYLLKDVLCDDDCEIVNFLYKKITGTLEPAKKNKKKKVSEHLEDDGVTIINNYYTQPMEWSEATW